MTDAEARVYADEQLARLRQGGLSGSITAFGGEIIDKLDAINFTLDGSPAGAWQVEKNDIPWGEGGQLLTLGTRLCSRPPHLIMYGSQTPYHIWTSAKP